jgi:transcriptional regulator with XRE-family HTH domain
MSTQKKRNTGLTGRQYDSVAALMRNEGVSTEIQKKVAQFRRSTFVSTRLAELRQKTGITQVEMAEALGVNQSTISKLEAETDDKITLKDIFEYARVTGERISLTCGKPFTEAELLQGHANALKNVLDNMAEVANQNPEKQGEIKKLLGDTFHNLFNIIAMCNGRLPVEDDDAIHVMRMDVISGKTGNIPAESESIALKG